MERTFTVADLSSVLQITHGNLLFLRGGKNEDLDYACRLTAAGASTELLVVPEAYRGFNGLDMSA